MTGTQLAALIRYKTRTNATTFPDSEMLPLVNIFKDEISSKIVERNAGYFLVPSTFDLVADQREYGFDDNLLNRLHKLELKFTSTANRQPAKAIKDYPGSEAESEIVLNFNNDKGGFAYCIRRRAVFILSGTIISVTAGGRMWANNYPSDLPDLSGTTGLEIDPTTTTFGFPRQFHELLATKVASAYKDRIGRQMYRGKIILSSSESSYESDLEKQLQAIATVDDSLEIIGEFPPFDDKLMGNNGFKF